MGVGIGYNNSDWPFPGFNSSIDYRSKDDVPASPTAPDDTPFISKTYKPVTSAGNPSRLLIMADTTGGNSIGNFQYLANQVGYRHLNSTNVLFMDSHVGGTRNAEIDIANGNIDIYMKK